MGDHWHTYTITNALSLQENEGNPPYTLPTPHARRLVNALPEIASVDASVPTEALSIINVFDGTAPHLTTSTLPLTTKAPTTITKTIPGTTAVAKDDPIYAYPADGCWDDQKCWSGYTHSKATATATPNPAVKGYDSQSEPSAKKFFKTAAPLFGLGIGIVFLILLGFWIASRYRTKKQKRKEDAKERQSKRMSDGAKPTVSGGNAGEPIELDPMRRDGNPSSQEDGFGERADTWGTHATSESEGWFRGQSEFPRTLSELERRSTLGSLV